jgi:hypothetical protein
MATSCSSNNNNNKNTQLSKNGSSTTIIGSILLCILQSLLLALLLITWEDVTCTYTLSSRHQRTSSSLEHLVSITTSSQGRPWGWSTVRGLAFGQTQRLELIASEYYENDDDHDDNVFNSAVMPQLKSYNEVMLQHRQERVVRWKKELQQQQLQQQQAGNARINNNNNVMMIKTGETAKQATTITTTMTSASAIHILCDCLQQVWNLRDMAENYKWNEMQRQLKQEPLFLTQLEAAASYLRATTTSASRSSSSHILHSLNNENDKASVARDVIGFDWGSCAWRGRHACGALADAQEALDQLDSLTGLLEPYEAIFCLDIVERSIRDILAVVIPLYQQQQQQQYGNGAAAASVYVHSQDVSFWQATANAYKPHRIFPPVDTKKGEFAMSESLASDQQTIDEDYLKAIQNLRID